MPGAAHGAAVLLHVLRSDPGEQRGRVHGPHGRGRGDAGRDRPAETAGAGGTIADADRCGVSRRRHCGLSGLDWQGPDAGSGRPAGADGLAEPSHPAQSHGPHRHRGQGTAIGGASCAGVHRQACRSGGNDCA
eukprot:10040834-Lingulodinium_polyedra.AAC.1